MGSLERTARGERSSPGESTDRGGSTKRVRPVRVHLDKPAAFPQRGERVVRPDSKGQTAPVGEKNILNDGLPTSRNTTLTFGRGKRSARISFGSKKYEKVVRRIRAIGRKRPRTTYRRGVARRN